MAGKIKELFNKYRITIIQFVKFNFVGIVNTLLDYGIMALMHSVFNVHEFIAKPISYTCGIVNSFIMNKLWTFKKKQQSFKGLELAKFIFVNLVSLGAAMLVIELLKRYLNINPSIGNIMVTPVTYVINFFLYKFWVFKSMEK